MIRYARLLAAMSFLAFAIGTIAFLYATFRFGYIAALRPGEQHDPEFDAACLSLMGALTCGALAFGSALGFAAMCDEEGW